MPERRCRDIPALPEASGRSRRGLSLFVCVFLLCLASVSPAAEPDPAKEVQAYKEACRAGFMASSDVVALTGGGADIEDIYKRIALDAELAAEHGLRFDVGGLAPAPAPAPAAPAGAQSEPGSAGSAEPDADDDTNPTAEDNADAS